MKEKINRLRGRRIAGLTVLQMIIIVMLLAALFFFSDNSIQNRMKLDAKIRDLESQIDYYKKQVEEDKTKLNELQTNDENLEKFARENYFMKRDDEEIFVFE
ncbi:MAG: FtsB family cell division protein [Fermentimonas sp.]|jgi:cell division protein DivIC